jgi:hypothetical protein
VSTFEAHLLHTELWDSAGEFSAHHAAFHLAVSTTVLMVGVTSSFGTFSESFLAALADFLLHLNTIDHDLDLFTDVTFVHVFWHSTCDWMRFVWLWTVRTVV